MKVLVYNDLDTLDDDFVNRCVALLPEWRRSQMTRYKFRKGQIQNGLAYLLLVRLLRDEYGDKVMRDLPEFCYNEHGKPFLKNYPETYFSISHCQTAVAVATSRLSLGIDIEDIKRYKENVAEYVSNDVELKRIKESGAPEEVFVRLWTQKEAVFKLAGTGITDDIKNILYNIDCQLYTTKIGSKILSIATNEHCREDIFEGIDVRDCETLLDLQ